MKKKAIVPFLMMLGTFFAKAQLPSFTASPNEGEVNQALTVKITGNNTTFGKDGSCTGPNCSDLGSMFYFKSGTVTVQVPYQTVNLVDDNHAAIVDVVLPSLYGTWQLTTETGLPAANNFIVKPKPTPPVPYISLSPTSGVEGKPLSVTITGTHTKLGYNGSCAGTNCTDIGTAMYFRQSSLTIEKTIPYQSVNVVDSTHVEVSITLPEKGYYSTRIDQLYAERFEVLEDVEKVSYINISPNTAYADQATTLSITSEGFNLGYNGTCMGKNCKDLGSGLIFGNMLVHFLSVNLIDSNHAEVRIVIPTSTSNSPIKSTSGLVSSQNFKIIPVPVASIALSTNTGVEGQLLTVTITGNNINLGHNGSCANENCWDIGNAMYFQQSSFTTQKTVPFETVNIIDSNHIEVSMVLPSQGTYWWTRIGRGYPGYFYVLDNGESDKYVNISPNTAESGQTVTLSVSSEEFNLGYNGSCTGSNCIDLGTKLLFGSTPVSFQSVDLIDSNHAEVVVTVPYYHGVYYLQTETELKVSQSFYISPKPVPSISLSPNEGVAGKALTITITGNNTNLGYHGSCSGEDCLDISDYIYFYKNSMVTNTPLYYQSVNVVDSNHVEVSVVLPEAGIYHTSLNGIYSNQFTVKEDSYIKHFTISPSTAEAGKTVKLILSSNEINLGYNGSCTGTNCRDLGTELLFGLNSKNIQSVQLIDSNRAEVTVTIPSVTGSYTLKTKTGLESNQGFTVINKPYPVLSLSKNKGVVGELLTVTITGGNTKLGYNGSCTGESCVDIGSSIYFYLQSSHLVKTMPFEAVNVIDSNHIDVSFTVPNLNTYKLRIGNILLAEEFTAVAPTVAGKAELSGDQSTCGSYAMLSVKFSGKAPWSIVYQSEDGQLRTRTGIYNANYKFYEEVTNTYTFSLIEASDANGACQVSGTATVTAHELLSADLQRDTTYDPRSYVLTLTGQSPWVVTLSNNGQLDSLLITENTYRFSVAEVTYDVYLTHVRDVNCTNGLLTGLNGIVTGAGAAATLPQLHIYPNPSSGKVNVTKGTESVFYNSLGAQVFKSSQDSFDVSHLPKGFYNLHLNNGTQRRTIKFVKD